MGVRINSFTDTHIVYSFSDMEDLLVSNYDITEILMPVNMNLELLKITAENLLLFDIKIFPEKTKDGWVFQIERG